MAFPSFGPASYADADGFREEIIVQAPPSMPKAGGNAMTQMLPYLLFPLLGMGSMSIFFFNRSGGAGPLMWIVGGASALGMVAMLVFTLVRSGSQKKLQINDERRDYMRYLVTLRSQVQTVADRQGEQTRERWPGPADLWLLAGTGRMWRQRPGDPDFAKVRLATGPQLLTNPLRVPETAPLEDLDPVSSVSLRRFIRAFAAVPDLPVSATLRAFSRVAISGERPAVLGLARAIVAQLATYHAPTVLRVAVCVNRQRLADWDWVKWLPHAADPGRSDAAGLGRLCGGSLSELVALLGDDLGDRPPFARNATEPDKPHIVVVLDGGDRNPHAALDAVTGQVGVTIVDLGGGPPTPVTPTTLDLVIEGRRLGRRLPDAIATIGTPDHLDAAGAEFTARQLAALDSGRAASPETAMMGPVGLADLLGIGDPRQVDTAITWRRRSSRDRLRVPIGVDPDGRPIELDLKESAEGGMGPHGLVIGATGSGKSELLRTLVTALAVTHSSETLNLALVDFKGGATFAGMASLPHTCAVITNLSDELTLVDRMGDALRGEMVRRQELLRSAGNFASVRDYERQREAGAPLPPLPSLLVIIDEFSELLSERPELTDLFVMIGRLGRSLAIHLLFASQRLEEGRLRGLDSHLSYRIGLRTFSASESRAVLGVPDAYELPSVPGAGLLKMDTSTLVRFKSAYVSGELPAPKRNGGGPAVVTVVPDLVRFALAPVASPQAPAEVPEPAPSAATPSNQDAPGETIMGTMLGRLEGRGPAAHQIWLPPLAEPATIDQLMPGLKETDDRGFTLAGWAGNGKLTAVVAIVDKPFEQRRDLLWADFSGAAGNAVVVGAPQSGKSTLLRTLVLTLALAHTPTEAQFFFLDFGGGSLAAMSGLPHVSGAAGRLDTDRCRRIVAELVGLLDERERAFAERGVDSMAAFRANPFLASDGRQYGDVFLIIDGWLTLRQEFEVLEEAITMLAGRGLGYGIHVLLSANRWMDVRPALRDLIGTQFELRLGDPSDSAIDRRAAVNVPQGSPGRGLTAEKLQFLTALPRVDGRQSATDLAAGVADAVKRIDSAWRGPRAPQVRLLPSTVPLESMPAPVRGDLRLPIGIAEADLKPVYLDFTADPHFIAFGDIESGKSGLLRLLARQIMSRYSADEAVISIVDYRRSLLGVVPEPYLLDYCGSSDATAEAVAQVERAMRTRLPGPDVTPEQLRTRSWWKGPELFLLVDDYDLVATQGDNPLAPLAPYLAQARDIGLHLVVVRRTGGAGRALYEPLLQRIRDLASPGLQLSGSRDEGALISDVKPSPQPPGRGYLVTRREGARLVQVAWNPAAEG